MSDVTEILERVNAGTDPNAAHELANVVYSELRIIARARMRNERPGHTLQPTELVHVAWLKLFPKGKTTKFSNHSHFFGAASSAMRRILVDHARKKYAQKRGEPVEMSKTEIENVPHSTEVEMISDVDDALTKFAKVDQATAKLVELKFFGGLTMQQAAKVLRISKSSAERDYDYFKAWFEREFPKRNKRPFGARIPL